MTNLLKRLRPDKEHGHVCPFCMRDPYHYVDIGVGYQAVAVECCELGIALFQHGDDQLVDVVGRMEESADRLTAMKAAGDGLEDYTGHDQRCEIMTHGVWTDPIPCTCGLTAALKQWKEASDGL